MSKKIYAIIEDDELFSRLKEDFSNESINRLDNNIAIEKNIKDISLSLANNDDILFIITDLPVRDLYTVYMFNTIFIDTQRMHFILLTDEVLADDLLISYEFGSLDILPKKYLAGSINKVISFVGQEEI